MSKKNISIILKILTVITSLTGVIIGFFNATYDGYSHWSSRLLYFTTQSNIWIGVTFLIILILHFKFKNNEKLKSILYLLKYIFTVSITITGVIFCAVLGPNVDDSFHAWSLSSLLTHVFTPLLAIVDYFVDDYPLVLNFKKTFLVTIPPFIYLVFASVLGFAGVDFGRGDNFPYFFLNYNSPAGVFGFSSQPPFVIGSFYWIVILLIMVLSLGWLFYSLHPTSIKRRRERKQEKINKTI